MKILFNELKKILENKNEKKEILKSTIQKIFTKIRNILNDREDELLIEIDNKYDSLFFQEDIIKEGDKLPKRIKESIERGKKIENEWNNNELSVLINDCLNIENNIKELNIINEKLKYFRSNNLEFQFFPEEDVIIKLMKEIKKFWRIISNDSIFKFKKCPNNINENRKYEVGGEKQNIVTKTGNDQWMGAICEKELDKSKEEYIWTIKALKTKNHIFMVGVATTDFDFNSASWEIHKNYGWYYHCGNGLLYSGPPHNYKLKETNLKYNKNEIKVVMNMKKKTLKFIIDNEDKGDSYTNIPLDKPIIPSVLLFHKNDSIEISEN